MTRQQKVTASHKLRLISRDEALRALGGLAGVLRDCYAEALDTYNRVFAPHLPLATIRGKANCIHELAIEQVRQRFAGISGVIVKENICGGRFLVVVPGAMILQFKKLTQDFHTTNHPTENSLAFDRQERRDDLPDLARVTVGYKLGQYGVAVEGLYLALAVGKHCEWWYDLNSGESTLSLDFPTPNTLPRDDFAASGVDVHRIKLVGEDDAQ